MDKSILENNGINLSAALELLGDMEMYNDILKTFLAELDTRLNKLRSYKDASDYENYGILAHSIKSDSKYLGFTKLAEMSLEHENAGKSSDHNFINSNFDAYVEEITRIKDVSKSYLGE